MSKIKLPDKSTAIVILVFIAVIAAIGLFSHRDKIFTGRNKKAVESSAIVQTERARADSTVADKIVQNMSVEARRRVQLLPRVTGRLMELRVKQGSIVRAGDVVATLEHDQQNALVYSAAAQLAAARAETAKAKAEMLNAKTNVDRYRRLYKEGFSTQQQLDAIETEHTGAAAALEASRAKERQYSAESTRAASTKEDYIIRAPMDGIVLNDYTLTKGAMISPSSPVLDIADPRRLKATLKIPELKIFAVKIGMPVLLAFDALPGEKFTGSVTRIDQYVDPATRTSSVEIELDNDKQAGGRLRPGMFGTASIVEKEYKNAITVADGALHTSEEGYYAFIVRNGKAIMRQVKIGIKENGRTQITDGLNAGDEVITFGGANLKSGEAVSVEN